MLGKNKHGEMQKKTLMIFMEIIRSRAEYMGGLA